MSHFAASKLRITSRRQIFSSRAHNRGRLLRWGSGQSQRFPALRSLSNSPRPQCWLSGPLGSLRPYVFVPSSAREHPPGGLRNHGNAKNSGEARAIGEETPPHSCRPAKKKKVKKEAFQVKLLGSEKPRFRYRTRGGKNTRCAGNSHC